MSRSLARLALGTLVFGVAAVITPPLAGCGATGNQRFPFTAQAAGAPRDDGQTAGPLTFTNETGWTITLTKADVTLGPVYLNVIAPLREASLGASWVKTAHAHGDSHLDSGRVVGEALGQVTFDALSPLAVKFPVSGTVESEQVRTLDVWFYPAPGVAPETTKIDTVALAVAGEAVRGADDVRFRGALVLDDAWLSNAQAGQNGVTTITSIRQVRGVPVAVLPTSGGTLTLRFDVKRCFRGADFSNLAANPTDPDGTKILVQSKSGKYTTDQVMTNVYQGVRATATYAVTWTP
jgi:hypothetical protein